MLFRGILILFFAIIISLLHAYGQQETTFTVEFIPQKFVKPVQGVNLLNTNSVLDGNIWEVFSDRTFNTSQESPSKSAMFKTLQYLEKYYVVESQGEYLHLFKDMGLSEEGLISEQAIDYGWVSAKKMLLWKHCLTDKYGRNKRVFMFNNKQTIDFFKHFNLDNEPKSFQVLYVFKAENNRLLLSRSSRLTGDSVQMKESILGWVNKDLIYDWTNNVFIQPDQQDIRLAEDRNSNVFPVFGNKGSAKMLSNKSKIKSSQVIYQLSSGQVWYYNVFRFPLLGQKKNIGEIVYSNEIAQTHSTNISSNNIAFNTGFCVLDKGSNINAYKTVVLLSKNQLSELLTIFERLSSLLQDQEREKEIQSELKEIFGFPPVISNQQLDNASLYNLFEWKYGLLPDKNLNDPPFYRVVNLPVEKNIQLINKLDDSKKNLMFLFSQQVSNNSFFTNGSVYYWVPLNHFPLL